jgi:YgiT-type zinc finger domain-containing protein
MNQKCPRCHNGGLKDELIESWEKRMSDWILIRGVPALICDDCGFEVIGHETAKRLADFTSESGSAVPSDRKSFDIYDFADQRPGRPARRANSAG